MTHAGSVAQVEEQIIAEGTQLIWVMTEDASRRPGTAENCRSFLANRGSDNGICVGDSETMPAAYVFRDSPFAAGRGIDLVVRRSDMRVLFASDHGTPSGNDNLTGTQLLNELRTLRGP